MELSNSKRTVISKLVYSLEKKHKTQIYITEMRVGDDEKHQSISPSSAKKLRPIITRKCAAAAAAAAGRKRDKRDHSPPPDQKNILSFSLTF
jgi:hypothetical protein